MPLQWTVERVEDISRSGRTRPLHVACALVDTDQVPGGAVLERRSMLMKGLGLPYVTDVALFSEYFGSRLAVEFGIDAPRAELIDLGPDVLQASDSQFREWRVQPFEGRAVGVEYRRGLLPLDRFAPIRGPGDAAEALRIYAFDLLTQNPDRRVENPNCASFQGRLVAYDFEMAFSFLLPIVGPESAPWQVAELPFAQNHLFHRSLSAVMRRQDLDLQPALDGLARLEPDRLSQMTGFLPPEWQARGALVAEHLLAARGRADEFMAQLKRSLS